MTRIKIISFESQPEPEAKNPPASQPGQVEEAREMFERVQEHGGRWLGEDPGEPSGDRAPLPPDAPAGSDSLETPQP